MQPLIKDWPVSKAYGFRLMTYGELVREFFHYIIQGKNPNDCWSWRSHRVHGYPVLRFNGRLVKGSRLSWEVHSGLPLKDGYIMCHNCNNPECCNPRHVEPDTHQRNMDYMNECGRSVHPKGEELASKLTEAGVVQMRLDYATGHYSLRTLGQKYGVSKTHARYIVSGRKWKSANGPITNPQQVEQ